MRVAWSALALLPGLALAQPARTIGSQEEALALLAGRLGADPSTLGVSRAFWNTPYGAWCFRFAGSAAPRTAAVSTAGTVEMPSRACIQPPTASRRPAAASRPEFNRLLGQDLRARMNYPLSAKDRGAEGRAVVRATLRRDGSIQGTRVEEGSGHEDLDLQALHMVRTMTVPVFPPDMAGDSIDIRLPVQFVLGPRRSGGESKAPEPS